MVMQGWGVDDDGLVDTKLVPGDIVLPIGTLFQPKTTTEASFTGNLPSDAAPGTEITTSIRTYDLLGTERTVSATFTRDDLPGTSWTVTRCSTRTHRPRTRSPTPPPAPSSTSVRTAAGQ